MCVNFGQWFTGYSREHYLTQHVFPETSAISVRHQHWQNAPHLGKEMITCFKMPAAISWLQSKMTWNSLPLFISLSKGFASFVSAGNWRIFRRRLYRDGALISSCNRMRPFQKKRQKAQQKIHYWNENMTLQKKLTYHNFFFSFFQSPHSFLYGHYMHMESHVLKLWLDSKHFVTDPTHMHTADTRS